MFTVNNEIFETLENAQDYCYEQEVIYYHKAIEYLSEHDPSLRESFECASNYGVRIENLTSEDLATLLYQKNLLNDIKEVK